MMCPHIKMDVRRANSNANIGLEKPDRTAEGFYH